MTSKTGAKVKPTRLERQTAKRLWAKYMARVAEVEDPSGQALFQTEGLSIALEDEGKRLARRFAKLAEVPWWEQLMVGQRLRTDEGGIVEVITNWDGWAIGVEWEEDGKTFVTGFEVDDLKGCQVVE